MSLAEDSVTQVAERASLGERLLQEGRPPMYHPSVNSTVTLRASLSGTFPQEERCREPVLGVCPTVGH